MSVNEEERGGDYKPDSKEENVGETFGGRGSARRTENFLPNSLVREC